MKLNRRSFLGTLVAIGAGVLGLNRGKVLAGPVEINPAVTKDSVFIGGKLGPGRPPSWQMIYSREQKKWITIDRNDFDR